VIQTWPAAQSATAKLGVVPSYAGIKKVLQSIVLPVEQAPPATVLHAPPLLLA